MPKGIIINPAPVTVHKRADQQQQRALRLMEVGDKHLDNLVVITRRYYYLGARMKGRQRVAVEPVAQSRKSLRRPDAAVCLGLRDAGYIYINIDDGFFGGRAVGR